MEIKIPKIKNPFAGRKEAQRAKFEERKRQEAKVKFWIQAYGDRLYVCCEDTPVLPLDMLSEQWQGRYKDVLEECVEAYVSHRMGEY